jgi:hypothetical protein
MARNRGSSPFTVIGSAACSAPPILPHQGYQKVIIIFPKIPNPQVTKWRGA